MAEVRMIDGVRCVNLDGRWFAISDREYHDPDGPALSREEWHDRVRLLRYHGPPGSPVDRLICQARHMSHYHRMAFGLPAVKWEDIEPAECAAWLWISASLLVEDGDADYALEAESEIKRSGLYRDWSPPPREDVL